MQGDHGRSAVRVAARASERAEADELVPNSMRVQRRKSRIERASDAGVWSAVLYLVLVAFLMPLWFLGVALALASPAVEPAARTLQVVLLALGTVATWFGLKLCFTLAGAPRLGRGPHRNGLRWVPILAGVLSVLFLHRFIYNGADLASDPFALIGAIAPALMLVEISWALPSIAKRRYGTAVGTPGGLAWIAAGIAVVAVAFMPGIWWLPLAVSVIASVCTTLAAVRLWRHYEGEIVTA